MFYQSYIKLKHIIFDIDFVKIVQLDSYYWISIAFSIRLLLFDGSYIQFFFLLLLLLLLLSLLSLVSWRY